jgi:hypothetical protein
MPGPALSPPHHKAQQPCHTLGPAASAKDGDAYPGGMNLAFPFESEQFLVISGMTFCPDTSPRKGPAQSFFTAHIWRKSAGSSRLFSPSSRWGGGLLGCQGSPTVLQPPEYIRNAVRVDRVAAHYVGRSCVPVMSAVATPSSTPDKHGQGRLCWLIRGSQSSTPWERVAPEACTRPL